MADHSQHRQKWPPSAHIKPCAPRRHVRSMGDDPPEQADIIFNSLTAKSILAGTKNSRSEGFLLGKHLKHTAHKHHHHDGAVCLSSGMVLMEKHTPPPGASSQAVLDVAAVKGYSLVWATPKTVATSYILYFEN